MTRSNYRTTRRATGELRVDGSRLFPAERLPPTCRSRFPESGHSRRQILIPTFAWHEAISSCEANSPGPISSCFSFPPYELPVCFQRLIAKHTKPMPIATDASASTGSTDALPFKNMTSVVICTGNAQLCSQK